MGPMRKISPALLQALTVGGKPTATTLSCTQFAYHVSSQASTSSASAGAAPGPAAESSAQPKSHVVAQADPRARRGVADFTQEDREEQTQLMQELPLMNSLRRMDHKRVWKQYWRQVEVDMPPSHFDGHINDLLSPESKHWQKDQMGFWENNPPEYKRSFELYKEQLQAERYPETIVPEHRQGALWDLRHSAHNNVMGPQPRLAPASQQWVDGLLDPELRDKLISRMHVAEEAAPYPGAQKILQWEVDLVLHSGPYDFHPRNQVAKLKVHMKHLQAECRLSDDAVQHMLRIATWQPFIKQIRASWRKQYNQYKPNRLLTNNSTKARYDPRTGFLMLWCRRYPDREDNRRHLVLTLHKLVRAGRKAFPTNQAAEDSQPYDVKEDEAAPFWPYSNRQRLFSTTDKETEAKQDVMEPQMKYENQF